MSCVTTGDYADLSTCRASSITARSATTRPSKPFEKALAINPNYTDAALNLSVTYNDRGKYKEARDIYSRAIKNSYDKRDEEGIDPFARGKLSNMHAELGDAYAEISRFDDAVREYERALGLSPSFVDIRTKLGHVLREMGRARTHWCTTSKSKRRSPTTFPPDSPSA